MSLYRGEKMPVTDSDHVVTLRNEVKRRDDLIEKMRSALSHASDFMSDVGAPNDLHEEIEEAIALANGL